MDKVNERLCIKCGHDDRDKDGFCRTITERGSAGESYADCGCQCYFGLAKVKELQPQQREQGDVLIEVIDERVQVYGDPVVTHVRIAQVWSGILNMEIQPHHVPMLMMGLKLVRTEICPTYSDNSDDIDGYLDIFRTVIGEDMVHARSVTEFLEKRDG